MYKPNRKMMYMPFTEDNTRMVSHLYRRALRTTRDWVNRPEHLRAKCVEVRRLFEINRDILDPTQLKLVLERAVALLDNYQHPDPIIPPGRPGGTKYERNIPPPQGTLVPSDA